MVAVVGRPKIVVGVDAQAMGMQEESLANALNKISLHVIFGEHGLGPLKQKDVTLGIYRNARSFARNHPFGNLEEVRHNTIRKFGNGLECRGLRSSLKWQEG